MRFHRDALVMYLLESANYTPSDFIEGMGKLLDNRSDYQLIRLEKIIRDKLYSSVGRISARARA